MAEHRPVYGVDIDEGGKWPYQLAVDECSREFLREAPLQQFIDGLFCRRCGVGFVLEALLKSVRE